MSGGTGIGMNDCDGGSDPTNGPYGGSEGSI